MDLILTLAGFAAVIGIAAFARWRAGMPSEPLKVRLINYHYLFITCVVVLFIVAAHLITLVAGHPLTGSRLGVH